MSETTILEPAAPRSLRTVVDVPLNRVEGDLEIRVELADGHVVDAWSAGTLYRGFENIMVGRAALDGLVITPRICGMCSTAHLTAAAKALDAIAGVTPPPDAVRIRNIALLVEQMQNDVRQSVLMFMADFANRAHQDQPQYEEAVRRFEPLRGSTAIATIAQTRRVLEIVAILGGQWPHSSYMVPGGVVSLPGAADLLQCRHLLAGFRQWYEREILGCSLERWLAIRGRAELEAWLDECPAHQDGAVGFFLRFGRRIGLDRIGAGHDRYLSVGGCDLPAGSAVRPRGGSGAQLVPAGFAEGARVQPVVPEKIAEHVACSWCGDYGGGRHPFDGITQPYATGSEGGKYSWAKAPRYGSQPAETGPLGEMVVAGQPLFVDLLSGGGPSALVRQLARLVRPAFVCSAIEQWLKETQPGGEFYGFAPRPVEGQGVGLTQAARGALGHWVKIAEGRIQHYQIITPTAWNGSPRDSAGVRGPWEEALIGTPVRDPANPVELGHVVRSFDPCLVCAVHALRAGRTVVRKTL